MFKTEWTPIVPAVTELAGEARTLAVWLIGSRANGTERKDSDWDLMVFCEQEPVPVPQKREFVDILRVGPSGRILLEGKSEEFVLQLANFQWKVIAKRHASYVGTKFIEPSYGVAVDYHSPRVLSLNLKAILLWSIEDGPFST